MIIFYYSPSCGSCKDYEATVDKLSTALKIEAEKQNIDETRPSYKIEGIPCVILERNGIDLYKSLGNVPFGQLYKNVKEYV